MNVLRNRVYYHGAFVQGEQAGNRQPWALYSGCYYPFTLTLPFVLFTFQAIHEGSATLAGTFLGR